MAQGRMLKKNISVSEKMSRLKSDTARMLYLMILPHLDIKGRFYANPIIIKGKIVPLIKRLTFNKIEECLKDMDKVKLINLYEVDEQKYLEYTKFTEHQNLRPEREAKSSIPAPLQEYSRTTPAQDKLSKDKLSKDNISKYPAGSKKKDHRGKK